MMPRNRLESITGVRLSGEVCIICGWCERNLKNEPLLIGAHVRPFKDSDEYDTYKNIVALCPNHHAQFDAGTITIHPDNHEVLCIDESSHLHQSKLFGKISHVSRGYIDYHFKQIFGKGLNRTIY